ncbi:hypothetical protein V7S43_015547 [Phytophthora oleae]|uniref:Uncharacterized protein n=1 Tax=Phytophthora oleae TaxID=2107226 RepID=A0ABD3F2F0_9STRA
MLEQAVEELQFLQKQEERALENQVRVIRESYALRLEVFQQQYLNKVAEIEDEMYASIQKRQEECDSTILAAAKKLQDQTQRALVKDLATVTGEPIEEQLDSSSISTDSSSASQPKAQRHRLRSPQVFRVVPMVKQVSPISQQRAKLQALEDKLAAFSPESLNRVKDELATPVRRSKVERIPPKNEQETVPSYSRSIGFNDFNGNQLEQTPRDADEWRASPLSPLRKGPSYWRNGISLEACDNEQSTKNDGTSSSKTSRRQTPASLLNRRFLRPEEEEELRRLRTSIGLAKDWMARHSQT